MAPAASRLHFFSSSFLGSPPSSPPPEVARALHTAAQLAAGKLRAKELLETIEAYRYISEFALEATDSDTPIVDVACGHGLLAVLLAYRFPRRRVIACDTEKRGVFSARVRKPRSG